MGFGFKKREGQAEDDTAVARAPEPEPAPPAEPEQSKPKKKSWRGKAKAEADDGGDGGETAKSKPESKAERSCCASLKRAACCSACLLVLLAVALLAWRYGPWSRPSDAAAPTTLAAENACEGCCNGLPTNCDLPVNRALFGMVRSAHASRADGFVPGAARQDRPLEEALVAGYRALGLATCLCEPILSTALLERDEGLGLAESDLGFCDAACGAGVRDPKGVLTNLKSFLETNPREVLIVHISMGDGSSSDLRTALRNSGLLEHVYRPDEEWVEEWPTLGELIDADARLLLFATGDGMTSCPTNQCDDGVLFADDHWIATRADGSDLGSCDPASGPAAPADDDATGGGYFLMHHYEDGALRLPSAKRARELNAYGTLEARFGDCAGKRRPSLLAVEFWDEGAVPDFVSAENKRKNRMGGEYGHA